MAIQSEKVSASNEEIENILDVLEPVLAGHKKTHVLLACLSLVFTLQYPDISDEDLGEGISGASKWVADFLNDVSGSVLGTDIPKEKLN